MKWAIFPTIFIFGSILGVGGALRFAYGARPSAIILHHDAACPVSTTLKDYYEDFTRSGALSRYAYINGRPTVHPGDVMLDCGSWTGDTAGEALKMGASLVVAIDPSEIGMVQLRKNLARGISEGRVIVKQVGVLDRQGRMDLYANSGQHFSDSLIKDGGLGHAVTVTTIDRLVEELGLSRVDYIKMDIEGSEQKALVGAAKTIQRFKPRLAIASYHLSDDFEQIQKIVGSIRGDYLLETGRCRFTYERVIPNLLYFR